MSDLEEDLLFQIRAVGLPTPEREYRFHPVRRWRADMCWPDKMVMVEVEGGVFVRGRHNRGAGFVKDCEKYNAAAEMGYRIFRYPAPLIKSGEAIKQLESVLNG